MILINCIRAFSKLGMRCFALFFSVCMNAKDDKHLPAKSIAKLFEFLFQDLLGCVHAQSGSRRHSNGSHCACVRPQWSAWRYNGPCHDGVRIIALREVEVERQHEPSQKQRAF